MPAVVAITNRELADFQIPGGRPGLSAQEEFGLNGTFEAQQVYLCDWGDRNTVVSQAAASPYPHNSGAEAYLYHARIAGVGKSSTSDGLVTYEKAVVWLNFSTLAPYKTGGKWVTEEVTEFNFTVPIPTEDLYWESGEDTETVGDSVEETAALEKSVAGLLYHVVYHHVASVPGTILTYKDGCNNAVFSTLTYGLSFPAGQVWYKDSYIRRTISLGGSPDFLVGLTFAYRPADWNKKWRPKGGGKWLRVYDADGTQVVFHTPRNLTLY